MAGTLKSGRARGPEPISGINVTPFVDIALVLLIIFMVTATYIVSQAIRVQLPKAATGEQVNLVETLALTLDETGKVFLDGEPTTDEGIREAIEKKRASGREPQVLISADREVKHGRVVRYVDLTKSLGVTKFAINTEQPK